MRAAGDDAGGQHGKHGAGRVDTVFKVGDRVLLRTKELLDGTDIGKLCLLGRTLQGDGVRGCRDEQPQPGHRARGRRPGASTRWTCCSTAGRGFTE